MVRKTDKQQAEARIDPNRPVKSAAQAAGQAGAAVAESAVAGRDGPTKSDRAPAPAAGASAKPPFDTDAAMAASGQSSAAGFDDQVPRSDRRTHAPTRGEQYIRLRVRVRDGRLSIADSHLVDGPLGQTTGFPGSHAYEVVAGDRLLHAGSLPDLGVQRSFVNPEGPPEERGHHFTERSAVEFVARVPAHEVTPETIGRIAVRLYRVKEEARADRLGTASLGAQFQRQIRQVAELVGLPESALPEAIEARGDRSPRT